MKLVADDGAATEGARGEALRLCLATRHPNLVRCRSFRRASPAVPPSLPPHILKVFAYARPYVLTDQCIPSSSCRSSLTSGRLPVLNLISSFPKPFLSCQIVHVLPFFSPASAPLLPSPPLFPPLSPLFPPAPSPLLPSFMPRTLLHRFPHTPSSPLSQPASTPPPLLSSPIVPLSPAFSRLPTTTTLFSFLFSPLSPSHPSSPPSSVSSAAAAAAAGTGSRSGGRGGCAC